MEQDHATKMTTSALKGAGRDLEPFPGCSIQVSIFNLTEFFEKDIWSWSSHHKTSASLKIFNLKKIEPINLRNQLYFSLYCVRTWLCWMNGAEKQSWKKGEKKTWLPTLLFSHPRMREKYGRHLWKQLQKAGAGGSRTVFLAWVAKSSSFGDLCNMLGR